MAPKALGFCHVPRREFGTPGAAAMAMGASFVSVAPTGHLRVRSLEVATWPLSCSTPR